MGAGVPGGGVLVWLRHCLVVKCIAREVKVGAEEALVIFITVDEVKLTGSDVSVDGIFALPPLPQVKSNLYSLSWGD